MAFDILGAGLLVCVALIVIIVIVFAVLWLFFKVLFAFFPSIVIAGLVWYFTNDFAFTVVAFLGSALFFAYMGYRRKNDRRQFTR